MKLYGSSRSPFVRKVRVVLEEKGLAYQSEPVVPVPKTPELLALHPLGKIPVLRDGDVVVPDSSVICAYLERKHPTPALYPADPAELARALFLEEYADTQMAEGMGALVFERIVKPQRLGQPSDERRLRELEGAASARWLGPSVSALAGPPLPSILDYLESQLPEGRDTLLARFSVADAALGAHLGWMEPAGLALDPARWPRTARYYRALLARPSFETALAEG
jgi:glutathione S-transferase